MYRFGINTFIFASPFTDNEVSLFPKFKSWGFDSVELAIEDPQHVNPKIIKKALDENGLVCGSICAAMGPARDLRGSAEEQQTSLKYLKGVMDIMPELGCPILVGPLYSAVGRAEAIPEDQKQKLWKIVAEHLRDLSDYAMQRNLTLAIEPLNRFETDFINTCNQGLQMIKDVNSDALKLHLDTFHMNIEEKDQAKAIQNAGEHLGHFHACGSDRGTPGNDHINWTNIKQALKQINYSGDIVIESFTQDVKVIAKAAAIWRRIEPSQDEIAAAGLRFLKGCFNETN